jgi:hypothetical protein
MGRRGLGEGVWPGLSARRWQTQARRLLFALQQYNLALRNTLKTEG